VLAPAQHRPTGGATSQGSVLLHAETACRGHECLPNTHNSRRSHKEHTQERHSGRSAVSYSPLTRQKAGPLAHRLFHRACTSFAGSRTVLGRGRVGAAGQTGPGLLEASAVTLQHTLLQGAPWRLVCAAVGVMSSMWMATNCGGACDQLDVPLVEAVGWELLPWHRCRAASSSATALSAAVDVEEPSWGARRPKSTSQDTATL
jgi:hypothetical protein